MRRSIFAIIGIALLQVSYLAYFHNETLREQTAAVAGRVSEPFSETTALLADLSSASEPTAYSVFGDELFDIDIAIDRTSTPTFGVSGVQDRPLVVKAGKRTKRGFRSYDLNFETTVITVQRSTPYEFRTREPQNRPTYVSDVNYTVEVRPDEPTTKRKSKNVFKKALPIVKKPYDWMRSLVSVRSKTGDAVID